jgi:hypothetical protein
LKKDKRSPLKASPLRNPGQSVQEYLDDQAYDHIFAPFILALFGLVLAILEWGRWYSGDPPHPIIFSTLSAALIAYAAIRIWRVWPRIRALKQARDGEKVVGQYLDALREHGFRILHDVVGEGFNIDHVLIGPAGVFTIETKTISKPARGDTREIGVRS